MINANQVTVIIPTYNRINLLKICIDSLANQTVSGFNVIILDNNSDDGTREFVSSINSTKFEVYAYSRDKNIGYFQNLIDGINRVETKYVTFLSDDNTYEVFCLQNLLESLEIGDDIRIVIGSHNLMSYEGIVDYKKSIINNNKYGRNSNLEDELSNSELRKLQLSKKIVSIDSSIFLSDQLQLAISIEEHGLDFTLFSQYIILGGNGKFISNSIMNYRENPQGLSQSRDSSIFFAKYVISACEKLLNQNNLTKKEIDWIVSEKFKFLYILFRNGNINLKQLMSNIKIKNFLNNRNLILRIPIISILRKFTKH